MDPLKYIFGGLVFGIILGLLAATFCYFLNLQLVDDSQFVLFPACGGLLGVVFGVGFFLDKGNQARENSHP